MSVVPKIYSAELDGIDAESVEVEADINVGLHSFNIVGLADKAVSEAKERVNSALKNSGIKPPTRENRKITVNLAPADTKKAGSRFDLPIAVAYLLASEQIKPFDASDKLFIGELSLDGSLRPVSGALNVALFAGDRGMKQLFVPAENAREAAIVRGLDVFPVRDIAQLVAHLDGVAPLAPQETTRFSPSQNAALASLDDVRGQASAKRALTVAAAGGHNILMSGPPGTGKTMLAQAITSILPPLALEESVEITKIYSAAGLTLRHAFVESRPFRAPHHNASMPAILGGGSVPRPGEVSLAHRGVLFMDEFPEFKRDALEGLRQPLEDGRIHVARARKALSFPSRFMLVAAMNPCPCGNFESGDKECTCTANDIARYQRRVSGPLLDRFDIQIEVKKVPLADIRGPRADGSESAEAARERVARARAVQRERFASADSRAFTNAEMPSRAAERFAALGGDAEDFLKAIAEKKGVSTRGYYRILKIARTIADLADAAHVRKEHVAEAFQYRVKE